MSNLAVSKTQTTMTDGMTNEQMSLFLKVARMGLICGLGTPYEWYLNYTMHPPLPFLNKETMLSQVRRAFANFFRGCASCEEEAYALYLMKDEEVIERFRSIF